MQNALKSRAFHLLFIILWGFMNTPYAGYPVAHGGLPITADL